MLNFDLDLLADPEQNRKNALIHGSFIEKSIPSFIHSAFSLLACSLAYSHWPLAHYSNLLSLSLSSFASEIH
jgi:hypothetical protein